MKEDTIELRNIRIPECHVEVDLDISPDSSLSQSDTESSSSLHLSSNLISMSRTKSVPSLSTLYSARKEQEGHADKVEQKYNNISNVNIIFAQCHIKLQ